MPILNIQVANKVATYQKRDGDIICNNEDYKIKFTFDREWDPYPDKIVRFVWDGQSTEVKMEGGVDTCDVPALYNTVSVKVGVHVLGALHTTTPAVISCRPSICCLQATPTEADKHYISVAELAAKAAETSAEEAKVSETNASASAEAAKGYMETAQQVAASSESLQTQITENADRITENADRITASSENLQAQIDRNSKRITNLEQGLVPEPFETDDSVTYMKDVPANALPYAEIQKVGGMTVKDEITGTLKSAPVTAIKSVGTNLTNFKDKSITYTNFYYDDNRLDVKLKPSTTYTLSFDYTIESTTAPNLLVGVGYGTTGFAAGIQEKAYTDTSGSMKFTFKTPASFGIHTGMCFVRFFRANVSATTTGRVSNVMFNVGGETEYKPYVETTLVIPEAVQALDGYGDGVNESVYNYIDWENGTFVEQVEKMVFDGSEDWSLQSINDVGLANFQYFFGKTTAKWMGIICNKYTPDETIIADATKEGVLCSSNTIFFRSFEYQTAADWKAHLAELYANGNPLTIVYARTKPEITDISDLITADNFIEVEPYGTLTFENEHQTAVPSEIVYQLKEVEV